MIRCEAVGSRNMRRMVPTSDGFLGRSISGNGAARRESLAKGMGHGAWGMGHVAFPWQKERGKEVPRRSIPSMSSGLFKSMRRMRPFDRASTRTLLATWAATKSAAMENCSCTLSTSKMGSAASPTPGRSSAAAKPLVPSKAMSSSPVAFLGSLTTSHDPLGGAPSWRRELCSSG
ncbi:hypothetical protein VTK73DRAFT_5609 [Phialemonium thermophilum]|uniref:Uncharacterized protein n=1 Tax=Phialemonium thermophilum TaxID=223376 RepID=A0ABR3V196_9PEZI